MQISYRPRDTDDLRRRHPYTTVIITYVDDGRDCHEQIFGGWNEQPSNEETISIMEQVLNDANNAVLHREAAKPQEDEFEGREGISGTSQVSRPSPHVSL